MDEKYAEADCGGATKGNGFGAERRGSDTEIGEERNAETGSGVGEMTVNGTVGMHLSGGFQMVGLWHEHKRPCVSGGGASAGAAGADEAAAWRAAARSTRESGLLA